VRRRLGRNRDECRERSAAGRIDVVDLRAGRACDCDFEFGGQSGRARIAVRSRPAALLTAYADLGSTRTVLAWAALGSSMFRMPSFKVALTFELSTSAGRSTTRRISFAHRSE